MRSFCRRLLVGKSPPLRRLRLAVGALGAAPFA